MRPLAVIPLLTAGLLAAAGPVHARQAGAADAARQNFDLLIVGGHVLDGTGNPWFAADIGVRDGYIASVGDLRGSPAERVIDATGRIVTPGFIDLHSHGDGALGSDDARLRAGPAAVAQGITTVVINQDGRQPLPTIGEQRARLEELGIGPNALLLVGHGAVRGRVMGDDVRRPARQDEIDRMREMVGQGMEQGGFGMSAALEYVPGRWSTTDEVAQLVEEIVPYGGVYIVHQRSEGSDPMWYWPSQDEPGPPTLLTSVRETIEIGERTGATVVASHIKAKGADYWGSGYAAIQLVEAARARGVRIYADQYPYDTSGSDGSTVLVPAWAFAGAEGEDPADALRRTLADPVRAEMVRRDIAHEIQRRGGADRLLILDHPDASYVGRTLAELASARGVTPVEMAIALQMDGHATRRGGAAVRGFSLSSYDIDAFAALPWVATASDGTIQLAGPGGGHPRSFGTFPRKIRDFALERQVISLEHAIRSSTSLPAQILGLQDRGLVREGMRADLVVIDLENVRERGTFFEPRQYPDGVDYVVVNGVIVVDARDLTWALPGKVITPQSVGRAPRPAAQ